MNLKFGKVTLNKKEFHRSKQAIYLNQVETNKIVISDEFKLDDGVKNFIGYKNGEIVRPLCIILPQMSGFIKYFENNEKNMSFLADDDVILKYNKIQKKIQKLVGVEFDSQPVYDEKYIKTKVKISEDKVITKFTDNKIPKENNHYSCTAAICINSAIKVEGENYPQVNLEQCKFGLKKKKEIDLFYDELQDSSDESVIETQ